MRTGAFLPALRAIAACLVAFAAWPAAGQEPAAGNADPAAAAPGPSPEDFEALVARARELAGAGTDGYDEAVFHATLRRGLKLVLRAPGTGGRGTGAAAGESLAELRAATPEPGVDDDPEERARVQALIEEGREGGLRFRIVGGDPVARGQFTETVAIIAEDGRSCSGTVIGESLVLTAAHCVCLMGLVPGSDARADVYFADPIVRGQDFTARRSRVDNARTRLMDPGFCAAMEAGEVCGNDIAVVVFQGTRPGHVKVAELGLEGGARIFDSGFAFIAGYGATSDRQRQLMEIGLWPDGIPPRKNLGVLALPRSCDPADALPKCEAGTRRHGCLEKHEIVIDEPGVDTCVGDSGGPIFLPAEASSWDALLRARQTVVGVTSRPLDRSGVCGLGGIYTSVFSPEARRFFANEVFAQ